MTTLKLILLAIIFVVTSGAVFSSTFRKHKWLVVGASIVAMVSSYYLFKGIYQDIIKGVKAETKVVVPPKPKTFTSSSPKNDYEPEMIRISRGEFTMGSYDGRYHEKPPHRVTIDYDFEIGKYEVTIGEYKRFIEERQSHYPACLEEGSQYNIYTGSNDRYKKMCWEDNCPIIGVSWHNATAYAKWLSEKTGKNYRLPSEAEWEYVARAGSRGKWSFGDNESDLKKYAWYDKNSDNTTHRVGTREPNPWGVYDMHGNVWEWCLDWYVNSYKNTPTDGSTNLGGEKEYRVLRGGSWFNSGNNTRSASRSRINLADRISGVGFRLLRTLP